jgi:hypothetical protein
MATSPIPTWAQEMSPHHRGPTGAGVLRLALVAVLVGLLLQFAGVTDRGQATSVDRGRCATSTGPIPPGRPFARRPAMVAEPFEPWPYEPPRRSRNGRCCLVSRPGSMSLGRTSRPQASATRGALGVCRSLLYGSAVGRVTSRLHLPTFGGEETAPTALAHFVRRIQSIGSGVPWEPATIGCGGVGGAQ